jgi:hypothetical protein
MEQDQKLSVLQKITGIFGNIGAKMASDKRIAILLIGSIVLVIIFIFVAFSFFSKKANLIQTSSLPPDVEVPANRLQITKKTIPAMLSLVLKNKKKSYKVNEEIVFYILADTGGQTIRGYDAVFKYDPQLVSFVSVKNLFSSFDYQQRMRGEWFMISGVQKLQSTASVVLKNTNLIELHFKVIQPGVAYFPLSFVDGRLSDSNLIDTKSNDILTDVSGLGILITK